MKHCFSDKEHGATSDLRIYKDGLMLVHISVPPAHRGKGFASALLKRITDAADAEGTKLYLCISADGGLSERQLRKWYLRHDFREHTVLTYLRLPKGATENVHSKVKA